MRYLTFAFFFISSFVVSQNYGLVDKIVKDYPPYYDLETLSKRIETDFKTEASKARAAFIWIANNIKYDIEAYSKRALNTILYLSEAGYKRELQKRYKQKAKTTFLTKKALCGGYSALYVELCNLLKIEAIIIRGISKVDPSQINSFKTTKNHAWNAVKINNKWHLLDVTWAAGFIEPASGIWVKDFNDFYYFTKPKNFISSHYPQYAKWQLLDNPVSLTAFYQKPIFYSHYYKSELKLSKKHNGNIKVSDNEIVLFFDKKSKKDRLYYTLSDDKYAKHLRLKKNEDDTYRAKINYNSNTSNILTLYINLNPIIDFTIN